MNWMKFEAIAGTNDNDGDGVLNDEDDCPNTLAGATVNIHGCAIFTLPSNNFTITVNGESCPDKENGKIEIAAIETHNYKLTLIGNNLNISRDFTQGIALAPLDPGTYQLCITVDGEDFKQCFSLEVAEGFEFSGKSSVVGKIASIEIEQGTAPFKVFINNIEMFETKATSFEIEVKHGDLLEVKTAITCEGKLENKINLFNTITAYPNPSKGEFDVVVPSTYNKVKVEVYNIVGQLIKVNNFTVNSNKIHLNLVSVPNGIYMVKLYLDVPITLKLIKE